MRKLLKKYKDSASITTTGQLKRFTTDTPKIVQLGDAQCSEVLCTVQG